MLEIQIFLQKILQIANVVSLLVKKKVILIVGLDEN